MDNIAKRKGPRWTLNRALEKMRPVKYLFADQIVGYKVNITLKVKKIYQEIIVKQINLIIFKLEMSRY